MLSFKFLFDPQTGSYQGIARAPFPDNCTHIRPHFSSGYKTCWDFQGRWKLIKEEEFFSHVNVQDVMRDYDKELVRETSKLEQRIFSLHEKTMRIHSEHVRAEIAEHQRTRMILIDDSYDRHESLKHRIGDLEALMWRIEDKVDYVIDLLTLGPLKRKIRRLKEWIKRKIK